MPKIVEMRQDRSLIKTNFDGYKLSLDPVPLLRKDLFVPPFIAERCENEQYSLLHVELFSMQNLLQVDPWARTNSYFVNCKGEIVRSFYNENDGLPESPVVVFRLQVYDQNIIRKRIKGDYNYSMRFISEKYIILCDGICQLYLLDTGDRLKVAEWKLIAKTLIAIDGGGESEDRNFMLYDCRLDIVQEKKEISLALGHIQTEGEAKRVSRHHGMNLHWAKWVLEDTWKFSILDTLEGKGSLYYCAFEPRAESLIICSNRAYRFRSLEVALSVESVADETPQLHDETAELCGFTWSQTDDDLLIKFDIRPDKGKTDYHIKCTTETISVKCADEMLLESALFAKVDQDLTTWTVENNFLQVTLVKQTSSVVWPSLLQNGNVPEETLENGVRSKIQSKQQPIVNLEAPIEECDFPMSTIENEIKIERFHLATRTITHTSPLGSSPPIFTTSLRPGYPLAIATRQDVDACLWLQHYNPSKPDEWTLRHEGNLHAFGYVQASKQEKKFIDCAPDFNYAIICESFRHIFLYKSNYDSADGLRNRHGPQVQIGKQHLITLDDYGEVLGTATACNVVTLLTKKCILYLQVN